VGSERSEVYFIQPVSDSLFPPSFARSLVSSHLARSFFSRSLARWDQNLGRSIAREYVLKANWIFNSSGAFTQPYTPDYPGIDSFKGHYVHTTEWDEKYDFEGKRIGIVGSGPTGS
jgi:cation diffusion facilitator CzcD-associated flavoprotein CzcO